MRCYTDVTRTPAYIVDFFFNIIRYFSIETI
jgi:hypothetical protein